MGNYLSLDETSLSNSELYTILTNKEANGKKGCIVAIVKGTKTDDVIQVLKKITTDKWRGYRPIAKAYDITQIDSNGGLNFKALHTMIHQIKSWIRTTYSWVSDFNINRYFNEFCFRINRSQSKSTIFNNLEFELMYKQDIKCNLKNNAKISIG